MEYLNGKRRRQSFFDMISEYLVSHQYKEWPESLAAGLQGITYRRVQVLRVFMSPLLKMVLYRSFHQCFQLVCVFHIPKCYG